MTVPKRLLAALLAVLFIAPQAPAEGLPDLGDPAFTELSPQMERRIGESLMRDMRWRDASYLDDPEVEDYLNTLGDSLVSASNDARGDFQFFAVKDATLNAYAWPGGFIGVHTGLVLAAESESELASVLAHEISHVTQRHIVRLYASQNQTSAVALAGLLLAILAARSNGQVGEAAIATTQAVGIQRQLNFTRDFEREADRIGVQTLARAGYDVRGMPSFFERLQKSNRLYDNNAPAYLRTHPLTTERIADMESRVAGQRYKQKADSIDFQLVRAKLRAARGAPAEAVADFNAVLSGQRMPEAIARYGLARAELRANDAKAAQQTLAPIKLDHPMVDALAAEIRLALGDVPGSVARYKAASLHYPASRALLYGYLEGLLDSGAAAQALAATNARLQTRTDDARLYSIAAKANAQLGKRAGQHRAQAELYALKGSTLEAIEQLELARSSKDGDFYEQSVIDVRLRELKKRRQDELAAEKGQK